MKADKKKVADAFGAVIRKARQESKLSQEKLANLSGVDRSHTGRLERAQCGPTLAVVINLAEPLGLSPSALVKRVEQELKKSR